MQTLQKYKREVAFWMMRFLDIRMIKGWSCRALLCGCFCLSVSGGSELPSPVFNYTSGIYDSPITLTVVNMTEGAILRYTTDGSEPNEQSDEWPGFLRLENRSEDPDVFFVNLDECFFVSTGRGFQSHAMGKNDKFWLAGACKGR